MAKRGRPKKGEEKAKEIAVDSRLVEVSKEVEDSGKYGKKVIEEVTKSQVSTSRGTQVESVAASASKKLWGDEVEGRNQTHDPDPGAEAQPVVWNWAQVVKGNR